MRPSNVMHFSFELTMLSAVLLISATSAFPHSANAFKMSDLDPTKKDSAVREGVRRADPTAPNSAVREGLRQVDPTAPNSAVREGLRQVDPTAPDSAVREGLRQVDPTNRNSLPREVLRETDITNPDSIPREELRKVDPSKKVDSWVDDRVDSAAGKINQQIAQTGSNTQEQVIKIAMVVGGLAGFLFLLSVLRGILKRVFA
jgi:hypothetical protein